MANELNNLHLINAPAGSGKTTTISKKVMELTANYPNKKILCITYTNRAADELKSKIKSKNVFIGTIHMFFNDFSKNIFKHKDVIGLYIDVFGHEIRKRIENVENKDNYAKSNEKYIEKYGSLSFDTIRENIEKIEYNESSVSAYYYGRLGHDDLLIFMERIFDEFPKIRLRLSKKYSYVFLDEYQDTSKSVLNIFYNSLKGTTCQLYLFGDKMQQIYDSYDGSFENEFEEFDLTEKLNTNYRSSEKIIDILNKLYNDSDFVQLISEQSKELIMDFEPKIIISNDIESVVNNEKEEYPDALILYVFNKKRFERINALNLFNGVEKISSYGEFKDYKPSDVLLLEGKDNPDSMMILLWHCHHIVELYNERKMGQIVQMFHHDKKTFDKAFCTFNTHSDKQKMKNALERLKTEFNKSQTIKQFFDSAISIGLFNNDFINEIMQNEEYENVLSVSVDEFHNLVDYIKNPNVSTQHGVKGESHNSVIFVSENSNNTPRINIYDFYKLWSQNEITLKEFEKFYYSYNNLVNNVVSNIGMKINDMKKQNFEDNSGYIIEKLHTYYSEYSDDIYFKALYKDTFEKFFNRQNLTNCKACLKISKVYGTLQGYRIFYVGCSRARKNLCVVIEKSKVVNFMESLVNKFQSIGFNVFVDET